ncbi:coiled-coil domain-containing protein 130 homolog [Dendroctonus ponderosae]|uniref:Coiled-coil domain-containing protein 130 homolog n=1 Tax=Dendroctonus ponderosae TaxID=77166 RepID=J3JXB1_DENPD
MGERKGTNKYYPPDYDPKVGGLNKFLGTHALRERARKIDQGIIIIRFEMPYNIWCEGCKNHVGMGVRYNAEKTKVGMYYTTPIYEFKMKCHLCDNHYVIRADPANLDYLIISGARRQENRWDPIKNGQVVPETKEVQKRLFDDKMYKLEHGAQDLNAMETAKPRLVKLFNRNEDAWADCYTANSKLRAEFRKQNYQIKKKDAEDTALLKKSSLDIPLLEERDEDRKIATLLSMKPIRSFEENLDEKRKQLLSQSALPTSNISRKRQMAANNLNKSDKIDLGIIRKNDKNNSKKEAAILDNKPNSTRSINANKESQPETDTSSKPEEPSKRQRCSIVSDYGVSSNSESECE